MSAKIATALARVLIAALQAHGFHPLEARREAACRA